MNIDRINKLNSLKYYQISKKYQDIIAFKPFFSYTETNMKTLLLNLPYKNKIIRRFRCSYNSPGFLFPPLELLSLGGIVKEWKGDSVELLDAVAESISIEQCIERITEYDPTIIVTITGLEHFQNDVEAIQRIKETLPHIKILCMGYYPTIFSKEILEKTSIDFLLLNEPELSFSKLYDCLKAGTKTDEIDGIAFKKGSSITINNYTSRIDDLDGLPYPMHSLLKKELYSESRL